MSVGKYIGSRYIPKAADPILHDSSKAYEHLMMVQDAHGGCWMSTKPVPPGIPLQQGEYWMFISDWDAQVAEYHAEVQRYGTRLDEAEQDITTNTQGITALDTKIGTEVHTLDAKIDTEVQTLDAKIDTEVQTLDAKVDENERLRVNATITPYCVGYVGYNAEYTAYDHPGAICEITRGRQVIISSPNTQTDNYGHWRTISIEDNLDNYTGLKTITAGHANSICYDGENIYIAPVWKWNNGVQSDANCVYKCDVNGNFLSEIPTTVNIMAVSFDSATGKLYFMGYDLCIYEYDKSSGSMTKVEATGAANHYNQDFAIYNGIYYLSSHMGNIVQGYIGGNGFKRTLVTDKTDASGHTSILGEFDGMEFNDRGELLSIWHIDDANEQNNTCFVCVMPVNNITSYVPYNYRVVINRGSYTQFVQSYNTILRPDGNEQSPHKGLAIRKVFYPVYLRWVITDNMRVHSLREIGKLLIHINQGCTLEILDTLSNQNEIVFDGANTATVKFPFPINVGNTGKSISGFVGGLNIVNSNNSRYMFSSTYTGCELILGSHTLADESEYAWASNSSGHTLKDGTTIVGMTQDNLW